MNKKFASMLLAALSLCCFGKGNLLTDPSFEGGTKSWKEFEFEGAETIVRVRSLAKGVHSGKKAIMVERVSGGSLGAVSQKKIAVKEYKNYILSAAFKTGKNTGAFLRVDFLNGAGSVLGSVQSKDDRSINKWGTLRLAFKTPSDCRTLRVILAMRGNTFAAFDSAVLKAAASAAGPDWDGFAARCLPVDTVAAWSGKKVFSTFEDSPCALTFQFKGKYKTLVKPALILDLPVELRIAQAFQQHPSWGTALIPEVTSITRNGKKYNRYRFNNPPFFQTLLTSWGWRRMMTVGLLPASQTASLAGKEFAAYWHLENKGTRSPEEAFTIRILKALPVKTMPKDFFVGLWIGFENDYPSKEIFDMAMRKMERSNMIGTILLSATKGNNETLRQRNFRLAVSCFQGDQVSQFKYMPEALQKKLAGRFYCKFYDGKINKSRMCPQFFLTDPDYMKYTDQSMKKVLSRSKPGDFACLDTEPWRPHNWCYCDSCIAAFQTFAKVQEKPTIRQLRSKYYSQWRAFRVEQSRLVIKRFSSLVRKYNPTAKICDYDYPINYTSQKAIDTFLSRCSKDPRGNEEFIDGHLTSFYYTLDQKMFDETRIGRMYLKKAYYPILAVDPPGYLAKAHVLSPARFRIMSVGAAALGCKGVWLYSTSVVDGATIQAFHDAMVKVAAVEGFYKTPFLKNPSVKVTTSSKVLRYTQHKAGKEQLLTLLNFDQKQSVNVTVSALSGKVRDALTGKTLPVKDGVLQLKLLPGEERFIIF